MKAQGSTAERSTGFIRQGRIVAGFAMLGTVTAGTLFGWVPALAFVDVHAIGAGLGLAVGLVATARHVV